MFRNALVLICLISVGCTKVVHHEALPMKRLPLFLPEVQPLVLNKVEFRVRGGEFCLSGQDYSAMAENVLDIERFLVLTRERDILYKSWCDSH